jgi:hypothetical protein
MQALLPGNYSFRIESPGFRIEQRANVTLQAADVKHALCCANPSVISISVKLGWQHFPSRHERPIQVQGSE